MSHKSIEQVAVVIPNFNGADFLSLAVDSLLTQSRSSTIIVVENGSSDNSMDVLQVYGGAITVIKNDTNLGFAGGVNTGIRYALENKFDAIALFNNDAIAHVDWLSELISTMERNDDTAIVTSRIQLGDGTLLDSTGEFYTSWGLPYPRGRGKPTDNYTKEEYIFGASGGASLYRSAALNEVGLFDEAFFAYYEDTDISFRMQLAGWKVMYSPNALVNHRQGETSKKMVRGFTVYQTMKNLPILFGKNVPRQLLFSYGSRFYLAYILILLKALGSQNRWAALKGFGQSVILQPHTIKERSRIQRNKKVTSNYINSIVVHDLPPDQTGIRKLRKLFLQK